MEVKAFFDKATFTLTYLVFDKATRDAIIIDPVLDFDPSTGISTNLSVDALLHFLLENNLNVHYILETHAHADHLSAAHVLVELHLPEAKIAIGERIVIVQETFKEILNLSASYPADGSQFHRLLKDNEEVNAGNLKFMVIFTPGHTPACVSYLFGDTIFTGDSLFMPDSGTGRCDFPKGDAHSLYHSIARRLYLLPDKTRVFVGHDYQPNGRPLSYETTIGESKRSNIHLRLETSENDFVAFRKKRDENLSAPRLLVPSIKANIGADAI